MTAPLSFDEPNRLETLRALRLVDTPIEERFERITRLARALLDVDIAAISLVEADRQFFKSIQGLNVSETGRDVSFCAHVILGDGVMHVPDAREDDRFSENPLVTGEPGIVTYAGVPLEAVDGSRLGALCVIDRDHRNLNEQDLRALEDLASMAQMELRRIGGEAAAAVNLEGENAAERRSLVDPVTRLWGPEGIERFAGAASMEARREGMGFGLGLFEVDGVEGVRGVGGDSAFNEAMSEIAKRALQGARECDGVGRVGSTRFMCVLDRCGFTGEAEEIASAIMARIGSRKVLGGNWSVEPTVRMGLHVGFPDRGDSFGSMTRAAGAALSLCGPGEIRLSDDPGVPRVA